MICRAVLFLAVLLCVHGTSASRRRQCVVDTLGLNLSTCDACSLKTRPTLPENAPQVMIVMSQGDPTQSPLMVIVARLVSARFSVLIVFDPSQAKLQSLLEKQIASSVPCDIGPLVSKLLSFQVVNETIGRGAPVESPYDALHQAAFAYRVLRAILNTDDLPKIMLLMCGLLLTESLKIPCVMVAPSSVLGLLSEKAPPWKGVKDFVKRRYNSIARGRKFVQLNKLRQSFGLPFLRTPSDYFESSLVVLVTESPVLVTWQMPPNVHLVSPLFPLCIPCDIEDDATATIVVMATGLDMVDARTVIRGLSTARAEFRSFFDTSCHPDSPALDIDPEACELVEQLAGFNVAWQADFNTVLPELLPMFVTEQSLTALEIIGNHPDTVAVISHCDSDSYPVFTLGHPLICLPTSNGTLGSSRLATLSDGTFALLESTSISHSVIRLLMNRHKKSKAANVDFDPYWQDHLDGLMDGGNLTVQIIQTIVSASQDHDSARVRELINERIGRGAFTPPDIRFVLAAFLGWNTILIILICYTLRVLYKKSNESFFRHFQELDVALHDADLLWWSNEDSIHNRIDRFLLRRLGPHEDKVPPEQQRDATLQHARRRRVIKKR